MNPHKAKMLGKFAGESGLFWLKRARGQYPEAIDTVVVDLDYALVTTLTAYRALEQMLGSESARRGYEMQKARVKSGRANMADVKYWGHLIQMTHGWTRRDWRRIAQQVELEGRINYGLVEGLRRIRAQHPRAKFVLTTGTSDLLGKELAAILYQRYHVRFDLVVGSEQTYEKGKLTGLKRFMGESHRTIPTIEKTAALKEAFRGRGWNWNPKNTMSISDADTELLRKSGVGVLISVEKSNDPMSYVAQKFKLRDIEAKHDILRPELLEMLAANPREAMKLARKPVKTPLGQTNALARKAIQQRRAALAQRRAA